MGYASPGVLTAAIDAGVPVTSVWEQIPGAGVRLRPAGRQQDHAPAAAEREDDRPLQHRLEARSSTRCWRRSASIRRPSSTGSSAPQWDAGRRARSWPTPGSAWEGLRAQLQRHGCDLRLERFEPQVPGRARSGARSCLRTATRCGRPISTTRPRGHLHALPRRLGDGLRVRPGNPRAAAQITYGQYPGLQKVITPQVALDSLIELASRLPRVAPAATAPVRLPLPGALDEVPERRLQARPDEDEARSRRRAHERPGQAPPTPRPTRPARDADAAKFKLNPAFKSTTVAKGYRSSRANGRRRPASAGRLRPDERRR